MKDKSIDTKGLAALARVYGIMKSKDFVPTIEEKDRHMVIGWAGFRRTDRKFGKIVAFYALFLDVICYGKPNRLALIRLLDRAGAVCRDRRRPAYTRRTLELCTFGMKARGSTSMFMHFGLRSF